ncbi:tricorn protease [Lewinella marina]|uniref:Tricorn protease homolog n=1 Tax=Neolewinella marina TaxID=438751 RepID=A0A2G0CHT4_9BACT|nr:S41 family peptidase [Neolewinella marina]NJB85340.1 tricorn protease [Neolewinella marina]PHK99544.1 peptidase S41 [Neolewinella marina]
MKLTFFLLFLSLGLCAQESPYFVDAPALTPDGGAIIFSYHEDLWRVPAAGGTAVRLTALEGRESNPAVSPDGRFLAFTSSRYGNQDVMVMPLAGGQITQLTFHEADDKVEGWSWDGQRVYLTSDRHNRMSTYAVEVTGGTPRRLFGDHYFNNIHNAAEHPDGSIYFNESWESSLFAHRKRYRGPFNPDIKRYDPVSDSYQSLTGWDGKDMMPVIDRQGTVYFLSDRDNDQYNLYRLTADGTATRLMSSAESAYAPTVSADGSRLAYVKGYQLYTLDPAGGEERKVPVTIIDHEGLSKDQDFNTKGKVTAFDVAGDGRKLAFVSRGELFVSDLKGKFIRQLSTGPGRVREVHWLKDHRTLLFNQTVDGYLNWFTMSADGSGSMVQRTDVGRNNRNLVISHDSTRAVYLSGRDELRLLDLEDFSDRLLVTDEFWAIQNTLPRWSPDDAYLAFNVRRNFEMDVMVYAVASGEHYNLTRTGVSEWAPYWSPDGRYLYFHSARHQPGYPRGGGDANVYRLPLRRIQEPFRGDRLAQLFRDEEVKPDSVTVIEPENIMERMEQIGTAFGDQGSVAVIQDGETQIILYGGDQEGGKTRLFKTLLEPFEEPKTESIAGKGLGGAADLVSVDGKHYLLGDGKVVRLNLEKNETEEIELDFSFRRSLRPEFEQMYYETWANLEENFYDKEFHGVNWREVREHYATFLPHVTSRHDLRRLINDMLGELNTSHFGFYSTGEEEETTFGTKSMDLGLAFADDDPYRVTGVLTDGPADYYGVDIRPGDRLVAIDGERTDADRNREAYLARPSVAEEVVITLSRDGREQAVRVHPWPFARARNLRYDAWVKENQRRVDTLTDRSVAYVHMKNMGGGELDNFLNEMISEGHQRNGLILDLRYNTGGNVHDAVLQFLSQRPYLRWGYREGETTLQPNFTPAAKPIVLLINEQSLSDAEMTAEGFKQLELGTVVGMPTYRWIIFTSGQGLVDGSSYRLPSWGCYTLEGENLEKTGVEPDIQVNNTMLDRLHRRDPQLDKAIELIQADSRLRR